MGGVVRIIEPFTHRFGPPGSCACCGCFVSSAPSPASTVPRSTSRGAGGDDPVHQTTGIVGMGPIVAFRVDAERLRDLSGFMRRILATCARHVRHRAEALRLSATGPQHRWRAPLAARAGQEEHRVDHLAARDLGRRTPPFRWIEQVSHQLPLLIREGDRKCRQPAGCLCQLRWRGRPF